MTQIRLIGLRAVALSAVCAVLASSVRGDEGQTITPQSAGIALQDGGVLYGHVVDAQNRPLANQEVRILSEGHLVIAVITDARGQFGVRGLRAGDHTIEATSSRQTVHLWAPRTAPPSAEHFAVMVVGQEVVSQNAVIRAQLGGDNYGPAIRGAVAGGLVTGLTYWALDYNPSGS